MRAISFPQYAIALIAGAFLGLAPCSAPAQSYPGKPIRLILGFPPGGGVDIVARQIAPMLSERLGQQVVIDNRAGAAGNIALEMLAKAPPDGYSLMLVTPSIAVNPALYRKLPFDPVHDFAPVTLVATSALILAVHPSLPAKSVTQLIALAKARPHQLSYSSGGNGSAAHLAYELFKGMTGVDIVHVPYKGIAPALIALLAGEVQLTFGTLPSTLPHVRTGKLRALAVTSPKRSTFLPDMPSVSEAGVPGYESAQWYGALLPAGTPPAIVARLNREFTAVVEMADVKTRLSSEGLETTTSTPEQFAAFIKSELAKWGKVVKESGMRID